MKVQVVENVLKLNDEIAQINRRALAEAGVFCVNLMGSPGCGKTTLLENTLAALGAEYRIAVLAGDLTTTRDAERLAAHCPHVSQINTGNGCHLDANQVRQGMGGLPIADVDLLFIENVGNLICPVGFDLGQNVKVGIFSATDGDDKPAKHPGLVLEADLLVLNKQDLCRWSRSRPCPARASTTGSRGSARSWARGRTSRRDNHDRAPTDGNTR
ncbi:MAG: hydrogenase nickel incorporation protein HypB [Planctomycetota bacterium]|jgi:hydrogenase nickel incorporation protein HypB